MRPQRWPISRRAAPSSSRADDGGPAAKKMRVPGRRAGRGDQPGLLLLRQVLHHRPGRGQRPIGLDEHVGQAARTAGPGPLLPAVQLTAGLGRAAGHDHGTHVRRLEHPEPRLGEVVRQVNQLEAEAQVGLVRAVTGHRVGVGEPRQGQRQVVAGDLAPQPVDHVLGDGDHVFPGDEGHLQVDLGELGLPVGAEVLVAEAPGELVVPLQPADHQELLEQLRGLWQRVPVTRAQPHRHQEVPRPLRGGPGQVGRLHIDEPVVAHDVADQVGGLGADAQRPGHLLAPDVQVAVLEPDLFTQRHVALDRERQRVGLAEDLQVVGHDLDRAGGQLGVLVPGGPGPHGAGDAHAEFGAQPVPRVLAGLRRVVTAPDDLDDATGVPQVDEDDATMVAPPRHPAGQYHRFTGVRRAQRPGSMGADHVDYRLSRSS